MFPDTPATKSGNDTQPTVFHWESEKPFHSNESFEDISGLEIADYALRHDKSEGEVWDLIRTGSLIARSEKGRIFVYEKTPVLSHGMELPKSDSIPETATPEQTTLPPLPFTEKTGAITSITLNQQPSELSLLIDHLNLAKEENREILQLTQESMNHMTRLTESIIASKDEIIRMKQTEMEKLEAALHEAERKTLHLAQEVEDLKILTKALSD